MCEEALRLRKSQKEIIRITLYPFTSHFYIVKLGCTGVYIFSYFRSKNRLWVLMNRLNETVLMCTHNQCFVQKSENFYIFSSEN